MKFEMRGKILTCTGIAMMIVALDLLMVRIYVNHLIQPVSICIAARDIYAEEKIKAEDIRVISVSEKYILAGTIRNKNDLKGKKCRKNCFIPAGSLFYEALIE